MSTNLQELDTMQSSYKAAVDLWIAAIKREEALASADHSLAEVDAWESAGFHEEDLRNLAKSAKKQYEDAIRQQFYGFEGT